jgi:hypothetical protein
MPCVLVYDIDISQPGEREREREGERERERERKEERKQISELP